MQQGEYKTLGDFLRAKAANLFTRLEAEVALDGTTAKQIAAKMTALEATILAAPAHHEHTLAVFFFFASAPLITGVPLLLKSPICSFMGCVRSLRPCTLFITPVSVSCFIPHVSAIYHPYPLSRRYTCIPHWCSCPL